MGFKRRRTYESTFRHPDYAAVLRRVQRIGPHAPRDEDGATLLATAAWFGHAEAVSWLVQAGEDCDRASRGGQTALLAALESIQTNSPPSCFGIARFLLEKGARTDAHDEYGTTALHLAASIDVSERIPLMLIDRGADLAATTCTGVTPILSAAAAVNLPILQALATAGANLHAVDEEGRTALFYALDATSGRNWTRQPDGSLEWQGIAVVHWLADRGIALDGVLPRTGTTLLMAACAHHRPELVARCLGAGANINTADKEGKTALFYADAHCARLVLDAGADTGTRDLTGATAWDGIHAGSDKDHLFQSLGFPPRPDAYSAYPDTKGRTKLMRACEREDIAAVERFVGSDEVNAQDRYGKTALHYLLDRRYYDDDTYAVLRVLLASPEFDVALSTKTGTTALHLVAKNLLPDPWLVRALLNHGADPGATDRRGYTPVMLMQARTHDPDVLELLRST